MHNFQRTDKLSSNKIQENEVCLSCTHKRDFTKKYRNYWPKAVYVELEEHYVKVDLKWQDLLRDMERRVIWHPGRHQHNNGRMKNRVMKDSSIVSDALRKRLSGERTWNSSSIVIFIFSLSAPFTQSWATRRTLGLTKLIIEVETPSKGQLLE
jgi:hypothetical protein